MSYQNKKFIQFDHFLKHVSQFESQDVVIIAPNLDSKKRIVNLLAKEKGTIPDDLVMRLSEFFVNLVLEIRPETEFLDKNLFLIYLNQKLKQVYMGDYEINQIEKAVEYISVFGPILSNENYRRVFEEYLEEDQLINSIYRDIYPLMKKIWDIVLSSSYLINQWSFGWIFKNFPILKNYKKTVYVYKWEFLKKIELDFFEELSEIWEIIFVNIEPDLQSQTNSLLAPFSWIKVVTPLNEVEYICKIISDKKLDLKDCHFIIPKRSPEYSKVLEVFISKFLNIKLDDSGNNDIVKLSKALKEKIEIVEDYESRVLNPKQDNDYIPEKAMFKNFNEYKSMTSNDLRISRRNDPNSDDSIELSSISKDADFYIFAKHIGQWIENNNTNKNKGAVSYEMNIEFLEWIESLIFKIPNFIKLSFKNWLLYLDSILKIRAQQNLILSFLNLKYFEDIEYVEGQTYFVLGCTQQSYEASAYTYLSDFEIDKLKLDLGFNFESKEFSEKFYDHFVDLYNKNANLDIHFLTPEFSLSSEKENEPKFLNQLNSQNIVQVEKYIENILSYTSKIDKELNVYPIKNLDFSKYKRSKESASSIEKYIKCPFIYFSEYILGLNTTNDLELQPNSRLKGSIFHGVLEKYLDSKTITEKDFEEFIEHEINKKYSSWNETDFIARQLKKYSAAFVKYVNEDRTLKAFQNRNTIKKELDFLAYFNKDDLRFSPFKKSDSDIQFRGKIDRIDQLEDRVYILDYKSSTAKSLQAWKKDFLIQMPLYGLMFIDGVIPVQGELNQLSYVNFKDQFKTSVGFGLKSKEAKFNLGLYFSKNNSRSNLDDFKSEINKFRFVIKDVVERISENLFQPYPIENKICFKCDWRDLCKVDHLN